MFRSPPTAVRCLALVFAAPALAAAFGSPPAAGEPANRGATGDPVLAGVRCEGLTALPCATIVYHLQLPPGADLSPAALDRAMRRLWRTGLVDDVVLTVEPTGGGEARLLAAVVERPALAELRLAGADPLTRARLERWLADLEDAPRAGEALDRPALARLRLRLERRLAAEGLPTRVTLRLEPLAATRVVAVFELARCPPGPPLAAISFPGAEAFAPAVLRRALRRNQVASLATRLAGRGRLDHEGLEADRRALERLYRRHGFKDVVAGTPRVEFRGQRAHLTFPISEGRRWQLGERTVSGNRALSDQRLLGLLERRDGALDLPAIEEWVTAIGRLYAAHGRLDTRVEHRLRERPGGRVDVVVTVDEGPVLTLGRLTVTGNRRTANTVVRRELGVDEGQVLDLGAVERGLARLGERGLFEPAAEPLTLERRGEDSGRVDLALTGREMDPYRIDLGGGWSAGDGLSGRLTFEARNLGGRGVAAGLRATRGDARDRLELYFVQPALGGRRQTLSGEIFDRTRRLSPAADSVQERAERGLRLAWAPALGAGRSGRLSLTRTRLEDRRALGAAALIDRFDRTTVTAEWIVDRRDDPFRPSRGLRARLSLAASADHRVGGRELISPAARLALFHPLGGGAVAALRLEAGRLDTSGGAPGSPLDAFFLGGPGSLRGFPTASIVARDAAGAPLLDPAGFRVGGDRFFEAGVELRFPLAGSFSGSVFVDAGEVWAQSQPLGFDGVRAAAGVELWLQPHWLPLPLRLTWAHNLDPLPGEDFDHLLVGLGAAF